MPSEKAIADRLQELGIEPEKSTLEWLTKVLLEDEVLIDALVMGVVIYAFSRTRLLRLGLKDRSTRLSYYSTIFLIDIEQIGYSDELIQFYTGGASNVVGPFKEVLSDRRFLFLTRLIEAAYKEKHNVHVV